MNHKLVIEHLDKLEYARREAFNSLRTNLQFCGDDTKIIMFTSCMPNEGKSTISVELARALGEDGKKTILIDADLRKSVLVGRYAIHSDAEILGLSHLLSGQKKLSDVIYETTIPNVDMILAGPLAPNPTELLGKSNFDKMLEELRSKYDLVLIDCPPLGSVIDAAVIAPKCDGAILVSTRNLVSHQFVKSGKKQLELTGVRILGVVLNKVSTESNRYGRYGRYGKYGKYKQYDHYGNE